ncbi:hypothetical protein HK104_005175 [Borealophlyctis nickersoniae]|nr:hypothetical protein HK104_005175 [Borealophlyctis nickersoniae]
MSTRGVGLSAAGRGLQRLSFNQRIVPLTPAKPIGTTELVKALKALHDQLSKLEQGNTDVQSLQKVRKDLISRSLIDHKDKAVRVLTACCLADTLRIFAPDAPYSQHELRDIFEFFAKQLLHVGDSKSPYFALYSYLLENLATVRSLTLVADLNVEELFLDFFGGFFDSLKRLGEVSKNIYLHMLDILTQLVEESQNLPEVITMIIHHFQKKKQDENPLGFKLASDLCNQTADKLQRYFCQHFGDVILSALKDMDEEVDTKEYDAAHKLILEINKVAPGVLLSVIPQLEEELKAEQVYVRTTATEILGELFAEPSTRVAATYPQIWKSWLGRRIDKLSAIRIAWVEKCLDIIKHHPDLASDISAGLKDKIMDPDEKVRVASIKIIGHLDLQTADAIGKEVLVQAGHRLWDKKAPVRVEAFRSLSKLFNLEYTEIVRPINDPGAPDKYGWIPGKLLETLYMDDAEARIAVERALHEEIFPPNYDDAARTDRLLNVLGMMTEKQWKAFVSVLERQAQTIRDMELFIEQCEKYNGGIVDSDEEAIEKLLQHIIAHIASKFPESKRVQAQSHLHKFAKTNDSRVYKLLKAIMDPQADYKPLLKNARDLAKRLESQSGVLETFSVLMRRISLTLVSKNSIPHLIEKIRTSKRSTDVGEVAKGAMAERIIKEVAAVFPAMYKSHVQQFTDLMKSNDPDLIGDSLSALARFVKTFPQDAPKDSESREKLTNFALSGTPEQAKFATILLAHLDNPDDACAEVMEKIVATLSVESDHLVSHLAALGQLALYTPAIFEEHHTTVVNFIVKELLMKNREKTDDEEEWVEPESLPREGKLKILGVKLLVKRLVPISDQDAGSDIATPVLKLLKRILESDGELLADKSTSPAIRSHLRLTAAKSMLRLAGKPVHRKMIAVLDMYKLSLILQDPIYRVRNAIVEKLCRYLTERALPFEYLAILMLAAHEPELDLRSKVKNFLARRAKLLRSEENSKTALIESTLVRFLHLLAHHPDFSTDIMDLHMFSAYIEFFLDIVATPENVSFLYYSTAQLKTVKDVLAPASENLYVISDLAQFLIQELTNHAGWSLPSYPGNVPLPKELFKKLPSSEGSENIKRSYLPPGFVEERTQVAPSRKKLDTPKKKEARSRSSSPGVMSGAEESHASTPKRKAPKRTRTPQNPSKRRRKSVEAEETPVRKNAARSAKSRTKNFKELSDEESASEDQDFAGSEEDADPWDANNAKSRKRSLTNGDRGRASLRGKKNVDQIEDMRDVDSEAEGEASDAAEHESPLRKGRRTRASAGSASPTAPMGLLADDGPEDEDAVPTKPLAKRGRPSKAAKVPAVPSDERADKGEGGDATPPPKRRGRLNTDTALPERSEDTGTEPRRLTRSGRAGNTSTEGTPTRSPSAVQTVQDVDVDGAARNTRLAKRSRKAAGEADG